MDYKDGRCKGCQFARSINSTPGGWEFVGCTHEPYQGKWVAEIKECPRDEALEYAENQESK